MLEQDIRYIYGLFEPNKTDLHDIKYVGQTWNPEDRLYKHILYARRKNPTPVYKWIRSLLAKEIKPVIKVLQIVSKDEASQIEINWIRKCREMNYPITNVHASGSVPPSRKGTKLEQSHIRALRKARRKYCKKCLSSKKFTTPLTIKQTAAMLPIKGGKYAMIDIEDWGKVVAYNWRVKDKTRVYTTVLNHGVKRSLMLSHIILDSVDKKCITKHINGNKLDFRKNNLKVFT